MSIRCDECGEGVDGAVYVMTNYVCVSDFSAFICSVCIAKIPRELQREEKDEVVVLVIESDGNELDLRTMPRQLFFTSLEVVKKFFGILD